MRNGDPVEIAIDMIRREPIGDDEALMLSGFISSIGLTLVQIRVPINEGLFALSISKDLVKPSRQLAGVWSVEVTTQKSDD
ncbi:MAG: hypothetical protein ACRYGP_17835 [Janthinobacterium lividum]